MVKNPFVNAVLAAAYIGVVVLIMNTFVDGPHEDVGQNVLLIPITVLSLFVLSAAVMGYLFLSEPLTLYFDGKKQEAVTFFFTTVAVFALITAAFVAMLFFLV